MRLILPSLVGILPILSFCSARAATKAIVHKKVFAKLNFLEAVTGGARPDDPLPIVVALHGMGDSPASFTSHLSTLPMRIRLILPQAPNRYNGGYTWYTERTLTGNLPKFTAQLRYCSRRIARWMTMLVRRRKHCGKPIVVGFSQGGIMAFALAVLHPQALAAALPVSGWLPPTLWLPGNTKPQSKPPILAFHGTHDASIPFGLARRTIKFLRSIGHRASLFAYPGVGHNAASAVHWDLVYALKWLTNQLLDLEHVGIVPRACGKKR